jgi:hypothetical protein
MHIRGWVPTSFVAGALFAAAVSGAPVAAQQAPAPKIDKKVEKAQQLEMQTAVRIVDAASAGQPAPTDIALTMQHDSLKAQEGRTFVPFTVTIDPATLPTRSVTMYVRAVNKAAGASVPAATKDKKDKASSWAFEDIHFLDLKAPQAGQPYRVSRAFAAPAGDYDVYILVKERLAPGAKEKDVAAAKVGLLKQAVTVPDYWSGDLGTSSIIIATKVEPLAAPLTAQEQVEQPYTFGMTQVTPAADTKISKTGELSIMFLIYNTQVDANKKPDISVEYSFYKKAGGSGSGEEFFNKTTPQAFNASTLPPQFDPGLGHQLVAGQAIPLATFPEGVYRLEITVTDKLSTRAVTKEATFSVTP